MSPAVWVVRRLLLAPGPVRAAAASRAEPHEAWMLRQSAEVRRSYVRDVLDRGGGADLEQAWMLLQPERVRQAYVDDVLGVDV
jgi:hypothetical protein